MGIDVFAELDKGQDAYCAINFNRKALNPDELKGNTDNPLYNISIPLLAMLISIPRLAPPADMAQFRAKLRENIITLNEKGRKLDYPVAVIDKLCCMHCIVLDEFIIHSDWGPQSGWENRTLLSELFGLRNGGELFYSVTEKALRQVNKMKDFLEVVYLFMQVGFRGMYRSRDPEQAGALILELKKHLNPAEGGDNRLLLPKASTLSKALPRSGIGFLSFSLISLLFLGLTFGFTSYWYKESYSLRAAPFAHLDELTQRFTLNTKAKDIVYLSRPEDIRLQAKPELLVVPLAEKPATPVEVVSPEPQAAPVTPVQAEPTGFAVQLASFSSEQNAARFLARLGTLPYTVVQTRSSGYFVLRILAKDRPEAQGMINYFQAQHGLKPVVISLDPSAL